MNQPPRRTGLPWIVAGALFVSLPLSLTATAQDVPPAPPETSADPSPAADPPVPAVDAPVADPASDSAPPPLPVLLPAELPPPPGLVGLFDAEDQVPQQQTAAELLAEVALPEQINAPSPLADAPLAQAIDALLVQAEQTSSEGRHFEAIQTLREAERLAPNHVRVIRGLGLAYAESGNAVRARVYLLRVAAHDATDREVLLLLTRYALQRSDLDAALAWSNALEASAAVQPDGAADRDTALLADYFRAQAFDQAKQRGAAMALYRRVLDHRPDANVPANAVRSEWFVINRRRSELYLRLGDMLLQGREPDPAAARAAYQLVKPDDLGAGLGLASRRVYVNLLLRDPDAATNATAQRLGQARSKPQDAGLVDYLLDNGVPAELIAQTLSARYEQSPGSIPLLAGLARVLRQDETMALAEAYLARPEIDPSAFRSVLELLGDGLADQARPQTLARLVLLTLGAIQAQPDQAAGFADILVAQQFDPVALIRALRRPEVQSQTTTAAAYLVGRCYAHVNRIADAQAAYERGIDPAANLPDLRVALAQLLLDRAEASRDLAPQPAGRFRGVDQELLSQAQRALGEFDPAGSWPQFELWVRLWQLQNNRVSARRALDERAQRLGTDARLRVFRAVTLTEAGQHSADIALADLRALMAEQPGYAPAYEAALGLIDDQLDRFNEPIAAFDLRQKIVYDLARNLPDSRLSMLEAARYLISDRENPQPAIDLLNRMIDRFPQDQTALYFLYILYEEQGDEQRANQMYLRMASASSPGIARRVDLCMYYLRVNDEEAILALIDRTLQEEEEGVLPGPPLTGELAASLLAPLTYTGNEDAAEPLYLRMVRRFPDSALLNNALGYRWACQNRNLRQARAMIQRAIDVEGENSAYLDSLAWVFYKIGDFAQAEAYQRKALEMLRAEQLQRGEQLRASKAVLYDHMGDILYRAGDLPSAIRHWQIARAQRVPPEDIDSDPELQTLQERVNAKITAAREGQEPPAAEVPGEESLGPEGHPADLAQGL